MRAALLALMLVACSDDDGDVEADAALAAPTCDPAVTNSTAPAGDGNLPLGDFAIAWTCTDGCDGVPPVMALADRVTITPDAGRNVLITWSGGASDSAVASPAGGCWRVAAAPSACRAAFYVCGAGGRPFVASLTWRVLFGDAAAPVQVWEMH